MRIVGIGLASLALIFGLSKCLVTGDPYTGLPPGTWRGVLKLENNPVAPGPKEKPLSENFNVKFEEVTEGELPFNFEVVYDDANHFHIEIKNGEEIIKIEDIVMGLDRRTGKDTIVINFPVYDSYIRGVFEERVIEGEWVVTNRENYRIPFVAKYGENYRFTNLRKTPTADLSGRWQALFEIETDHPYPAIGEFEQTGNYLKGTFLTETGDYRYLEGTVQAGKAYLSCFDGSHAFLIEARIQDDSLVGAFRSGNHYKTLWTAHRNNDARLADPDKLTFIKPGYDKLTFAFPNPDGKIISPGLPAYAGKVVLVQIMGTWCPNCRDETTFLVDYLNNHPQADLQVIGLAFERHKDQEKAMHAIRTYKEKMGVKYEIALAGRSDKAESSQALPMLNAIMSYPTLIFIDRTGQVRRIHTGFSGPATSQYEAFTKEFDQYVSDLLK